MLLLMAALAVVPIAAPTAALGQPALLHSDPAQGEATRSLPTAVRLRFNQPMRLDRLQVFDQAGAERVVRLSRDAATPSVEHRGGLFRLPPGGYRAEWAASTPAGQSIGGTLLFEAREREDPPRAAR